MTNYMKEAVKKSDKIKTLEKAFKEIIEILHPIGKTVFRGANHVFSTSLYDCVMFGINRNINTYKDERTDNIISKIDELKNSPSFKKSSGSASASKSRILKRIAVSKEIFG